jgi:NADPH-dependent ferric siderophore reductase
MNTPDPMLQLLGRADGPLAGASLWELEVASAQLLTPRMRRIEFAAPDLHDLVHQPGQDLMLRIPAGGSTVNRRYTIRSVDRDRAVLAVDAVVHGDGPGSRWLSAAARRARLDAVGPRGKIGVASAVAWHLFAGDESALPAMLAMAESVPVGTLAIVFAEVADAGEEQPSGEAVDVRWLHRGTSEPGRSTILTEALTGFALPDGPGHVYLAGEATAVTSMRRTMLERGVSEEHLSAKAYWSRGRANAAHGEPERTR